MIYEIRESNLLQQFYTKALEDIGDGYKTIGELEAYIDELDSKLDELDLGDVTMISKAKVAKYWLDITLFTLQSETLKDLDRLESLIDAYGYLRFY